MPQKFALFFILSLSLSLFSFADEEHRYDVKQLRESGEITSLELILEKLSEYPIKRLLEVELEKENDRYIYEIEYLDNNGRVFEIEVDAVTARVLKKQQEY